MKQIKAATFGAGKVAIRVGSRSTGGVKCGVFAVLYAPIGIVLPSGWPAQFQTALASAPYGARLLVSSDVATELAAVRALIRQGVKVLILTAQDSAAAAGAADEARVAGVKVIANDRLILGTAAVDYLVTFDNLAVGAAMGQYLVDKAGAADGQQPLPVRGQPRRRQLLRVPRRRLGEAPAEDRRRHVRDPELERGHAASRATPP